RCAEPSPLLRGRWTTDSRGYRCASASRMSPVPSGELSSTTSMSQEGSCRKTSSIKGEMFPASSYVAVNTSTRSIGKEPLHQPRFVGTIRFPAGGLGETAVRTRDQRRFSRSHARRVDDESRLDTEPPRQFGRHPREPFRRAGADVEHGVVRALEDRDERRDTVKHHADVTCNVQGGGSSHESVVLQIEV